MMSGPAAERSNGSGPSQSNAAIARRLTQEISITPTKPEATPPESPHPRRPNCLRCSDTPHSRCGTGPISMRSTTDLDAEADRSRRGVRPISRNKINEAFADTISNAQTQTTHHPRRTDTPQTEPQAPHQDQSYPASRRKIGPIQPGRPRRRGAHDDLGGERSRTENPEPRTRNLQPATCNLQHSLRQDRRQRGADRPAP